jgi:hypothetical protein
MRRTVVALVAAGYYVAVIYLTGLSTHLTSMSQFFGHALIYAAGVALISSVLFIVEKSSSKTKEAEMYANAISQIQAQRCEKKA